MKDKTFVSIDNLKKIFHKQQTALDLSEYNNAVLVFLKDIIPCGVLIEIKTKIIGNKETYIFYKIYNWLKENNFSNERLYILLPEKIEKFNSSFVSVLYLFNKGLNCKIAIYGNDKNKRVYEFIHIMYSGQLAPEADTFFKIITYKDAYSTPKVWGTINKSNVDRYVVSKKNLPLIPINKLNQLKLFDTKLSDYVKNNISVIRNCEKYDYKLLLNHFQRSYPIDENKLSFFKEQYYTLHFFKLLDNLNCLEFYCQDINGTNPMDEYYLAIKKELIVPLMKLPLIQTLILCLLLDEKTVKYNYIQIYNDITTDDKKRFHKSLISLNKKKEKKDIISSYVRFLRYHKQLTSNFTKGIYELVKNTIEHSSNKRGILTIRKIDYDELLKIKNDKTDIWKNYIHSTSDLDYIGDGKTKYYLDFSIIDDGNKGIIEKSLEELDSLGDPNKRHIFDKIAKEDKVLINSGLRKDEAELLFKMYFNPKRFFLNRQAHRAMASYGLFIFTKFIHSHRGIYNVQTNSFGLRERTISFYSSSNENLFLKQSSNCPFGTTYNVTIPITQQVYQPEGEYIDVDFRRAEKTPPDSLFKRMLTFYPIWEKERDIPNELGDVIIEKIKDIKTRNDKIALITLNNDPKVDRSGLLRVLSKILIIDNIDAIVVKNIKEQLVLDYLLLLQELSKIDNILIPKSKAIFFYLDDQAKSLFILAGINIQECSKINSTIIRNKLYNSIYIHPALSITEESEFPKHLCFSKEKSNPFFIDKNLIVRFDFIEKDNNGLTNFENEAKKALEKDINNGGYKWSDTHLKIGSKLHLKDFIYGKKMFQKNYEASRFAYSLALDIFLKKDTDRDRHQYKNENINYTFIGYGFYSELLVSRVKEFVEFLFDYTQGSSKNEINYAIVKDEDEIKFSRFFKDLKERQKKNKEAIEKIIIIVPISSTLTTCLKIENAFKKAISVKSENDIGKKERFQVFTPFYSVVVVGDGCENDIENKLEDKNSNVSNYWHQFIKDKNIITTINREERILGKNAERENYFQLYLESKWEQVENCKNCFPEFPMNEKPLFKTDKVAVTPTLIFKSPSWYSSKNKPPYFKVSKDTKFKRDRKYLNNDMLNIVHYRGQNKDFKYYLRYSEIVKGNKKFIEEWALNLKERNSFLDPYVNISKEILLIAPDKGENGDFIHLINRCVFQERANIIKVDPWGDYYLNFDQFFGKEIDKAEHIFYVDNLIATANTFLYIADSARLKNKKIEGIFTLINRLNFESYEKVTRLIPEENIYSFFDIYVPVIINPVQYCPMCVDEKTYKELSINSSLDVIRQYFRTKELPNYIPIKKEDLTEGNTYNIKNPESSSVLKLLLTHYLNKAFFDDKDFIKVLKEDNIKGHSYYNFTDFASQFREYLKSQNNCNIDVINELKLKSSIIKILSQYPFKRHRGIFIAVFYWVLKDLNNIVNATLNKEDNEFACFGNLDTEKYNEIEDFIDYLNYLRVLIKYGSILKIAYLLNSNFLMAINKIANSKLLINWTNFTKQPTLLIGKLERMHYSNINFKIFCASHISKSLIDVESRAIKLEENINKVQNAINGNKSFLELLSLENTRIISEFINSFEPDIPIITKIERNYKHDSKLKNYISFYENSFGEKAIDINNNKLSSNFRLFIQNLYDLNSFISIDKDKNDFEENAKKITLGIAKILGYNVEEDSSCGGFFIYKYQDLKNNDTNRTSNTVVMGKVGDSVLADLLEDDIPENSLTYKILGGLEYIKEEQVSYTWTNFTAYKNNKNVWEGENRFDVKDFYEMKVLEDRACRVIFYRISSSDLKYTDFNKANLTGHAVFVFYDKKCVEDNCSINRVRYIHVFRNKILHFFQKNYENDLFRDWIDQKEKNEYMFSLNHGIQVYEGTIKSYLSKIHNNMSNDLFNKSKLDLKKSIEYLTNKIHLMAISSKIESSNIEPKDYKIKDLIYEFENNYEFVLTFEKDTINPLRDLSYLNYNNNISEEDLNIDFSYPETILKELSFELLYNIRKHVIHDHYDSINYENKLNLNIDLLEIENILYFCVSNNHYDNRIADIEAFNRKLNKNKKDGLNLIHNILKDKTKGEVFVDKTEDVFKISIPIKNL